MATVTITHENLESIIADNEIVILDFWASWCGPCKRFAPTFEASSDKHPGVIHGKVNTEEQQQLAASFNIQGIPNVVAFKKGVILFQNPGMLVPQQLEALVGELEKADVETLMAEQEAAEASKA